MKTNGMLMDGMLKKQGGWLGLWKLKYFMLTETELLYFDKNKVYSFIIKSSTQLIHNKVTLVFKIVNENDKLCLCAENYDELDKWINALNNAISTQYVKQERDKK